MITGPHSPAALRGYALLALVMSAFMFYVWASFDGLPPRESLRSDTGRVTRLSTGKHDIKFALEGSERAYDYSSKGNAMGTVESGLRTEEPVTVLYDPASAGGPIYSDDVYYDALDLSTKSGPIRRYEEIEAAWRSDNTLALWMSPAFFCMAVYLLIKAQRARR